jgi:hypothetical protein
MVKAFTAIAKEKDITLYLEFRPKSWFDTASTEEKQEFISFVNFEQTEAEAKLQAARSELREAPAAVGAVAEAPLPPTAGLHVAGQVNGVKVNGVKVNGVKVAKLTGDLPELHSMIIDAIHLAGERGLDLAKPATEFFNRGGQITWTTAEKDPTLIDPSGKPAFGYYREAAPGRPERIVLNSDMIELSAANRGVAVEELTAVVLAHELAHAASDTMRAELHRMAPDTAQSLEEALIAWPATRIAMEKMNPEKFAVMIHIIKSLEDMVMQPEYQTQALGVFQRAMTINEIMQNMNYKIGAVGPESAALLANEPDVERIAEMGEMNAAQVAESVRATIRVWRQQTSDEHMVFVMNAGDKEMQQIMAEALAEMNFGGKVYLVYDEAKKLDKTFRRGVLQAARVTAFIGWTQILEEVRASQGPSQGPIRVQDLMNSPFVRLLIESFNERLIETMA